MPSGAIRTVQVADQVLEMSVSALSQRALSSKNIVSPITFLSLVGSTPGLVHPLALLSEHRKFDDDDQLDPVDKVNATNHSSCRRACQTSVSFELMSYSVALYSVIYYNCVKKS